jgi:voltage-gated potassium channel
MNKSFRSHVLPFGILVVFLALAPLGFVFLEGMSYFDGLYLTIITISTVGFSEIRPLHEVGRWYIILIIVVGLATVSYILKGFSESIIEGQLRTVLGKRKMDARLRKLEGHTIVAGYGRVGQEVARELLKARKNNLFVVVERDDELAAKLTELDILHVVGDISSDETLRRAGILAAKNLVSTVPSDADNVYLTLSARHLNPDINITARADQPEAERKLKRAGATNVVSPHALGGARMAHLAIRPNLAHFVRSLAEGEDGFGVEETIVSAESPLAGKTLKDLNLPVESKVSVVGIKKPQAGLILSPQGDTRIEQGDILLMVGEEQALSRFAENC